MIGIYEDTDSLSACQPEFGLAPDICRHCRFFVTAPCVRSMDPRAANAVRSLSPHVGVGVRGERDYAHDRHVA